MRSRLPLLIALFLIACTPAQRPADPSTVIALPTSSVASSRSSVVSSRASSATSVVTSSPPASSAVALTGKYQAYYEGVVGNGEENVLFFHAAWCPYCREGDAKLSELYATQTFVRSTYKVDYDTATALKKKYGVTQQHTFILINEMGNEIARVSFPDDQKLLSLLRE